MEAKIDNVFAHHKPEGDIPARYARIRAGASILKRAIEAVCPPSRETSIAMTNLEQAAMWANKSIAVAKVPLLPAFYTPIGELPLYQCFKVVRAMKIEWVAPFAENGVAGVTLIGDRGKITVSESFVSKHNPQEGSWYVVYADGYESISPAQAFESGYEKVES